MHERLSDLQQMDNPPPNDKRKTRMRGKLFCVQPWGRKDKLIALYPWLIPFII